MKKDCVWREGFEKEGRWRKGLEKDKMRMKQNGERRDPKRNK